MFSSGKALSRASTNSSFYINTLSLAVGLLQAPGITEIHSWHLRKVLLLDLEPLGRPASSARTEAKNYIYISVYTITTIKCTAAFKLSSYICWTVQFQVAHGTACIISSTVGSWRAQLGKRNKISSYPQ